ncbi:MAG: phosphatidylinositol-3-phosphatase [Acidobacteriaceae bacterium]
MLHVRCFRTLGMLALFITLGHWNASAQQIKTVFVIAMENHNWAQPANQFTGGIQQIYQNPNAPFTNSLVNGSAFAIVDGSTVHLSEQVAYATAYHNVLATPGGNNPHIHPSEPISGQRPALTLAY